MARDRRLPVTLLGAPGPYVLGAAFATLVHLPVRWYDDPDGPWTLVLTRAGLWGVGFIGLFWLLSSWWGGNPRTRAARERTAGWRPTLDALRRGEAPDDEWDRAAVRDHLPNARRGGLIGAVGGPVLLGGLAVAALSVDRPLTAGFFALVLVAVEVSAARTLTRVRRLVAALDATPTSPGPR